MNRRNSNTKQKIQRTAIERKKEEKESRKERKIRTDNK